MSLETLLAVALVAALAALALIGALVAWRVLDRAGTGLRQAQETLAARSATLPSSAATARQRLTEARATSESALWTVSNLDARIERARISLADRRAASDRLRASMMRNRRGLERLRNGARMLLRAIQMRREFLG